LKVYGSELREKIQPVMQMTLNYQPSTLNFSWNVNRTSEPGLGANESMPSGKWRKSTAFRQFLQTANGGHAQAPRHAGHFISEWRRI
jgi:hypothetical protein